MTTKPCICAWPNCSELYAKICDSAPTGHVWDSKIICMELPSTDMDKMPVRKFALAKVVNHHLQNKDSSCIF